MKRMLVATLVALVALATPVLAQDQKSFNTDSGGWSIGDIATPKLTPAVVKGGNAFSSPDFLAVAYLAEHNAVGALETLGVKFVPMVTPVTAEARIIAFGRPDANGGCKQLGRENDPNASDDINLNRQNLLYKAAKQTQVGVIALSGSVLRTTAGCHGANEETARNVEVKWLQAQLSDASLNSMDRYALDHYIIDISGSRRASSH